MSDDERLVSILGDWQERLDRGEAIDPERVISQHLGLAAVPCCASRSVRYRAAPLLEVMK